MKALVQSDLAEVAAIFEPNAEMEHLAKELAPHCEITKSFEQLLGSGIDGLVIATPSALHAEQTIAALSRGIAVFCQKPLGRDWTETKHAIDAAETADRLLKVDLSYRYLAAVQKILKLIHAGELGKINFVDLVFHNAYGPDKPWFYDPKLSGGGCLIDLGIHLVDLGLWMLGYPNVETVTSRLFCNGRIFAGRSAEVEDFATATIDIENGTRINLACSWKAHAGRDAVIEATFYGTNGGAKLRNVNGSFYDFVAERFRGTDCEQLVAPPDDWSGRAAQNWLMQLIESGNQFDSEILNLNTVAEVLDRIYEP